jgi:hypothetical protein
MHRRHIFAGLARWPELRLLRGVIGDVLGGFGTVCPPSVLTPGVLGYVAQFCCAHACKGGTMDGQSVTHQPAQSPRQVLSRRNIFRRAVGVAALGAAGGTVLAQAAAPARAAQDATVESGAVAPAVVVLADGATIAVDASLGNDFRLTIAGNRTMSNPANPADGQKITFQVTQGADGPFTLDWGSDYEFSTGLPQPTLSTTAGETDLLGFIYNASKGKWLLVAFDDRRPAEWDLPAVRRHGWTSHSRVVFRALPVRRGCRGHRRRLLAGRLLVVGVPVRSVHGGAEVRALVP